MPLQAWFPDETVPVEPGASIRLPLTIENPAPHRDACTITPAGIRAAWVTVAQPSIVLDPGTSAVVDVWFHPPKVSSTSAGTNEVSVRIIADSEPSLSLTVDALLNIASFDDRTLTLAQPIVRGRKRASFDLVVQNGGNANAEVRMRLIDPTERVDGEFDPPAVTVAPGSASTVRFRARARRRFFRSSDRLLAFEVDATETGHPTAKVSGSMLQVKTLSGRWLGQVVTVLIALGLMAAAWSWWGKPWVDQRIDERVAQVSDRGAGAASGEGSSGLDESGIGRPVSARLANEVPIGQATTQSFEVDDDKEFLVTDLVLQNPNRDTGRAALRIDDEDWYVWDLERMTSPNEFQPRVTPLRVPAASTMTFEVTCASAGDNTAEGCEIALLVGGRMVDVEN